MRKKDSKLRDLQFEPTLILLNMKSPFRLEFRFNTPHISIGQSWIICLFFFILLYFVLWGVTANLLFVQLLSGCIQMVIRGLNERKKKLRVVGNCHGAQGGGGWW